VMIEDGVWVDVGSCVRIVSLLGRIGNTWNTETIIVRNTRIVVAAVVKLGEAGDSIGKECNGQDAAKKTVPQHGIHRC
jgi:hypothetical protein